MTLRPEDIKLFVIDENEVLLLHIPTMQVYPINDKKAIDFLTIFQQAGNVETRKRLGNEVFDYYYSGMTETIKKSPQLTTLDISDLQNPNGLFDTIVLPISAHCTLKCPYCFAQTNGKFNFQDYTTQQTEKAVDFAVKNRSTRTNKEPLCITFFGGEPLMRLDIIKHTINYVQKTYPTEEVLYSITTNGTIINDEIIHIFKNNPFAILVSIDGPDNEFNVRFDRNGEKSFSKVIHFIDTLKQNEIYPELRATIVNTNPYIVETFHFFEEMKLTFFVSFAYSSENKSHHYSDYNQEILANIKKQFNLLLEYYLKKIKKGEKIYNKQFYTISEILRHRRNNRISCGAARSYFSITADGNIFSCTHFINNKEHAIGNIADGILDKSRYEPVEIEKITECTACWAKYFCLGHCTAQKIFMGKQNYSACLANECELEKIQIELYLKLYYYAKKYAPELLKQ